MCRTNPTSRQWDAAVGISRQYDDNMIGNSAKKPSPAFAWGKELELKIPIPPVPRACDNPAAGAGCCRWSEAPRACLVSSSPPGLARGGEGETLPPAPHDSPQAQPPRAAPRGVPSPAALPGQLIPLQPLKFGGSGGYAGSPVAASEPPGSPSSHRSLRHRHPRPGHPGLDTREEGERRSIPTSASSPLARKDPDVLNLWDI